MQYVVGILCYDALAKAEYQKTDKLVRFMKASFQNTAY